MLRPNIVTRQIDGSLWLIRLEGGHDISTAQDLRREVDRIFDTGMSMVVDLAYATSIDSAILGELLRGELHTQSSLSEHMVVTAPPGSAAARLFELVDATHTCFPVFDSIDAAIESCRRPAPSPA